jgi:hypothetical protein
MSLKFRPNSVRAIIDGLGINDSAEFPPEKYHSLKTQCYDLGFMLGRRFAVRADRERRVVVITRTE